MFGRNVQDGGVDIQVVLTLTLLLEQRGVMSKFTNATCIPQGFCVISLLIDRGFRSQQHAQHRP